MILCIYHGMHYKLRIQSTKRKKKIINIAPRFLLILKYCMATKPAKNCNFR